LEQAGVVVSKLGRHDLLCPALETADLAYVGPNVEKFANAPYQFTGQFQPYRVFVGSNKGRNFLFGILHPRTTTQ
jgi:hypothetical protein